MSQSLTWKRGSLSLLFVTTTNTRPVTGVLRNEGEKETSNFEPGLAPENAARAGIEAHASAVMAVAMAIVKLERNRLVTLALPSPCPFEVTQFLESGHLPRRL